MAVDKANDIKLNEWANEQFTKYWGKPKKNIEKSCWTWTGPTANYCYGKIYLGPSDADRKNKWKCVAAHRYSWVYHFKKPITPGLVVLQMCRNTRCVNPSHLYEGTHRQRINELKKEGGSTKGEKHGRSKLTAEQVVEMRELYQQYEMSYVTRFGNKRKKPKRVRKWTHLDISEKYGINRSMVSFILRGENWSHIGGPIVEGEKRHYNWKDGCNPRATKLSIEQAQEIKDRYVAGESSNTIAKAFNVSHQTVVCIGIGKTWKQLK